MKKKLLIILLSFLFLFGGAEVVQQYFENSTISQHSKREPSNFGTQKESVKYTQEKTDQNLYKIEYIIDGDTYIVWVDGKKEKVRVLGIDTPEKAGGFRVEGCFGNDASEYVKKKLRGKKIGLLRPKQQAERDKYGRLLRYVFLDGKDFGAHLIEEGYASSFKKFSHQRKKHYNELEKIAQKNKKGMWNPENCEYWGQEN